MHGPIEPLASLLATLEARPVDEVHENLFTAAGVRRHAGETALAHAQRALLLLFPDGRGTEPTDESSTLLAHLATDPFLGSYAWARTLDAVGLTSDRFELEQIVDEHFGWPSA